MPWKKCFCNGLQWKKDDFKRYTYVLLKAMWYALEKFCGMQ